MNARFLIRSKAATGKREMEWLHKIMKAAQYCSQKTDSTRGA